MILPLRKANQISACQHLPFLGGEIDIEVRHISVIQWAAEHSGTWHANETGTMPKWALFTH